MLTNAIAVGLVAFVVNAVVEAWLAPVKQKYPKLDTWWVLYVAWVLAGVITFALNINLFADLFPQSPFVGLLLTALVAGRGSNFLDDLQKYLKKPNPLTING